MAGVGVVVLPAAQGDERLTLSVRYSWDRHGSLGFRPWEHHPSSAVCLSVCLQMLTSVPLVIAAVSITVLIWLAPSSASVRLVTGWTKTAEAAPVSFPQAQLPFGFLIPVAHMSGVPAGLPSPLRAPYGPISCGRGGVSRQREAGWSDEGTVLQGVLSVQFLC